MAMTGVRELREARRLMDGVADYAAREFGFQPWVVKAVWSCDDPEDGCGFEACGHEYEARGGELVLRRPEEE